MINKAKKEIQFEQPSDLLLLANRYVVFIMAFMVLLILILGYFFILKPKIDIISSVELKNTETEERRVKNKTLLAKLKELEAEYQDIMTNRQDDLETLKNIVPRGSQVAELFVISDRLAKKHDFQLVSIDIGDSTPDKVIVKKATPPPDLPEGLADKIGISETETEIPEPTSAEDVLATTGIKDIIIHLVISKTVGEDDDILGNQIYDDFKDYVAEIENSSRLLDVQAITFNEIATEGQAVYTFNLDLISYYQ